MSEEKPSTREMDIPLFHPRKRTNQMIPTGFKSENPSISNEHIMELNVKEEILNQINAVKERNRALFPSRPLMSYSWYPHEGRGQESCIVEDRLYRNLRNTPPSIYTPYSSKEADPTRKNINRQFPRLQRNLGHHEKKSLVLPFCNSELAKPPLPRLFSFPCLSCVTEPKTDPETAGVFEKHRLKRRLPFSGAQLTSKSASRKEEKSVPLDAPEIFESTSRKSGFCVKGESLKQSDMKPYIPSSSVSHNEYMAHYKDDSDESDED